jgi:hypothetical protein
MREDKMPYALITALILAIVAILHGWRIFKGWTVQIGPHSVSMTVSWAGLVVAALLAIWGFSLNTLGERRHEPSALRSD